MLRMNNFLSVRSKQLNKIADNLTEVKERITLAANRCGRNPQEIKLVVVTKGRTVEEMNTVLETGHTVIGENRVQEAQQKYDSFRKAKKQENIDTSSESVCEWHLIGHLQRNKVKTALDMFEMIHSVDSLRLVKEISRRAEMNKRRVDILIQINTTKEASKFGLDAADILQFIEDSLTCTGVNIKGLMTIGKFSSSPEENRPAFALLRNIAEKIQTEKFPSISMQYLSMGMTNDFEIAIEEGANIVRIGRAIFE